MKGCDRLILTAVAVLSFISAPAQAQVLIDTLAGDQTGGPSPTAYYIHDFPAGPSSVGDDLRTAIPFDVTQGKAYTVDAIVLNVAARNSANQRLTVTINDSDFNGLPGADVSSYSVTNLPVRPDGSGPITYPFTSVPTPNHPVLPPGKYWVSLSTPDASFQSDIYWYNRGDLPGRTAQRSSPLNGTAWSAGDSAPSPQVRVLATFVPEPGCASLLALGALLLTRRR